MVQSKGPGMGWKLPAGVADSCGLGDDALREEGMDLSKTEDNKPGEPQVGPDWALEVSRDVVLEIRHWSLRQK